MRHMLAGLPMLVAAVTIVVAPPAAAQDPVQRQELQVFRDSLDLMRDVASLRGMEASFIERARAHRDDPMLHLRLGLIALRLHATDSVPHADDAISEFEWASTLQPEWPWPWFGLGLAESLLKDRSRQFAGGLWFMLGLDRESRAGAAFARSIAADPAFVEGLLAFARTALQQRIDAPLDPALDALRAATASMAGWHPDLLLERGRLERLAGHPDSAVRVFSRSLLLGRRPNLAWLELARTLPIADSAAATEGGAPAAHEVAYYTAAASNDADIVAMLRRDIEPIAVDSQLRAFDRLRDTARVAWLRTFWGVRDAMDLRSSGDRLGEHFRRWAIARRDFRLPPFRRVYAFGSELYRSGDAELDDRGIIWLRHGKPAVRIEWPTSRSTEQQLAKQHFGNESWRYDRPDGALVLHFVATDDPQDYRVVESPLLLDVPGDVIATRASEIPGMARLLRVNEASPSWTWVSEDVRLRGRRSVAVATRTDSWERQYETTLQGRAQWLPAGTREGRPLVHLVYAVDAAALRALPGADTLRSVPITVRAVALDRHGALLGVLDTVQSVPMPSPSTRLVAMRAEFLAQPGVVRVRLGVEVDRRTGATYPVDSLVVPAVNGDSLALSALLVGVSDRSLPWAATAADTVWLDANGVYAPSDTVVIYGEAYGLRTDVPATLRITITRQRTGVARLLGSSATAIALTERLNPAAPTAGLRRSIALSRLEPGSYVLELRIEQGAHSQVRRRGLTVRPSLGPG